MQFSQIDGKHTNPLRQVNTLAHFWTLKAFLPSMLEKNAGHVVTIASSAGLSGTPGLVDYCASKFAAVGMSCSCIMAICIHR